MRILQLIIFLLGVQAVQAHNPDLASLMIYEQNGKSILLIKSSLTAFEGEVDYLYGKDAYKTPEEFNRLVVQHFQQNCSVFVNGSVVTFSNVQVQLGHETNLFAELDNMPEKIESFSVRNALFADMHNNVCELILTLNGVKQKQYILTNANNHEVNLTVAGGEWVVEEPTNSSSFALNIFVGLAVLSAITIIYLVLSRRKRQTPKRQRIEPVVAPYNR